MDTLDFKSRFKSNLAFYALGRAAGYEVLWNYVFGLSANNTTMSPKYKNLDSKFPDYKRVIIFDATPVSGLVVDYRKHLDRLLDLDCSTIKELDPLEDDDLIILRVKERVCWKSLLTYQRVPGILYLWAVEPRIIEQPETDPRIAWYKEFLDG